MAGIPVGGRFLPDDQELAGHFLFKKVNGGLSPEEANWVPEYDLYGKEEPWVMFQRLKTGLSGGDVFVFTELRSKDKGKKHIDRRVGGGCWHGEDSGKEIAVNAQIKAKKKRFSYRNKDSDHHGSWILHEYSLPNCPIVLCRLRNKSSDQNPESEATDGPVLNFDLFDMEVNNPADMEVNNTAATAQPDLANNSDSPTEKRSDLESSHGAELELNNTTATAQPDSANNSDAPTEEMANLESTHGVESEFNNRSVKRRRLEFNNSGDDTTTADSDEMWKMELELALEQDGDGLEALLSGSSSYDIDFDSFFKDVPVV